MDTSRAIGIVTVAALLMLAGCGGGGSGVPSTGTLALQITDGPFFEEGECVTEAWIEVKEISVKSADGVFTVLKLVDPEDEVSTNAMNLEREGLWVNLLALTNGKIADLASGRIPTGVYSEIRLVIGDTDLVFFEDETTSKFKVPSGSSSGLKIKVSPPFVVAATEPTNLDLDFSLAKSFHTAGLGGVPSCTDLKEGQGKVIYTPVVRVINNDASGILDGFVFAEETDTLPGALTRFAVQIGKPDVNVYAVRQDPPSGATDVDIYIMTTTEGKGSAWGVGYYAFILEAGEYDLYLEEPQVNGDAAAEPVLEGVVVLTGEVTSQDIVIAPAAAPVTNEE